MLWWWCSEFSGVKKAFSAPNTCRVPLGNLASLSLPCAETHNFAASSGPSKALKLGRWDSVIVRTAASILSSCPLKVMADSACPRKERHSLVSGSTSGASTPNLWARSVQHFLPRFLLTVHDYAQTSPVAGIDQPILPT